MDEMSETEARSRVRINDCPECGDAGDVYRSHDEDGNDLLDTFVVVHAYSSDDEIVDTCGPFLWDELRGER